MMIATLKNWTATDRKAGNAYISIHDAYSNNGDVTVTVAIGQTARTALTAAGWTVASGTRKNQQGETQFTVEQAPTGLRAAQNAVGSLLVRAGL